MQTKEMNIFTGMSDNEINQLLNCFKAQKRIFNKERTIISYMGNTNIIGIVLRGEANIIRYDFNGHRTIIEVLPENSVFGELFSSLENAELSVVATKDCDILFIEYENIIKKCSKACDCHNILIDNMFKLLSLKVIKMNERIEVLAKRTIREKLLAYFSLIASKKISRSFTLPFPLTDLADYLSVDRSAMMREIKHLKEEGFIYTKGRKIKLLY